MPLTVGTALSALPGILSLFGGGGGAGSGEKAAAATADQQRLYQQQIMESAMPMMLQALGLLGERATNVPTPFTVEEGGTYRSAGVGGQQPISTEMPAWAGVRPGRYLKEDEQAQEMLLTDERIQYGISTLDQDLTGVGKDPSRWIQHHGGWLKEWEAKGRPESERGEAAYRLAEVEKWKARAGIAIAPKQTFQGEVGPDVATGPYYRSAEISAMERVRSDLETSQEIASQIPLASWAKRFGGAAASESLSGGLQAAFAEEMGKTLMRERIDYGERARAEEGARVGDFTSALLTFMGMGAPNIGAATQASLGQAGIEQDRRSEYLQSMASIGQIFAGTPKTGQREPRAPDYENKRFETTGGQRNESKTYMPGLGR
jgi:hypothetical protein